MIGASIYNYRMGGFMRQRFYKLGGGSKDYVDAGFKALACVTFDRNCEAIMIHRNQQRLQRELKEMEL